MTGISCLRVWPFFDLSCQLLLFATAYRFFRRLTNSAKTALLALVMILPWDQFWEQDCSAATENILVEAQALGLGAVWLGVHPLHERVDWLRELLEIPADVVPFALIALGYPTRHKPPSNRFDADRVHFDHW